MNSCESVSTRAFISNYVIGKLWKLTQCYLNLASEKSLAQTKLQQIRNSLVHRAMKRRASGIRPRGLKPTIRTPPESSPPISQFYFSLVVI